MHTHLPHPEPLTHAVDALALSPLVYSWGTNTANAVLLSAIVLRGRRGSVALAWRSSKAAAAGVALLSPLTLG